MQAGVEILYRKLRDCVVIFPCTCRKSEKEEERIKEKKRSHQAAGDRRRFRRLHLAVDKRSGAR